jgi:hypothetical protein
MQQKTTYNDAQLKTFICNNTRNGDVVGVQNFSFGVIMQCNKITYQQILFMKKIVFLRTEEN